MGNSVTKALDLGRNHAGEIVVPEGYVTPIFPSLYLPSFSVTQGDQGVFLFEAEAIWHFTLYWTLILIGGIFVLCSLLASFSLLLSQTIYNTTPPPITSTNSQPNYQAPFHNPLQPNSTISSTSIYQKPPRKKPPLWPIFLLPIVVGLVSSFVALISGTVVGFTLATIYAAGGFSMSTWVPFLWALIQIIVLIISSYSTLTSIL